MSIQIANTTTQHVKPIAANAGELCGCCHKAVSKLRHIRGFRSAFCEACFARITDNMAADDAGDNYDKFHIWRQGQ